MIRVVLADDQELLRAGFRALIDSAGDMQVVGEASDGAEAVQLARSTRADVVLMDIRMPGMDGLVATREITTNDDLAGVRILILTTFEMDDYVIEAVRSGASGFLGKGVHADALTDAIRTVAAGKAFLSPRAARILITALASDSRSLHRSGVAATPNGVDQLTDREREIVGLVATDASNVEIAEDLYLSPLTVKTHVNRAMMKVHARDRAQLVVVAYQAGLASDHDIG